MSVFSIDGLLLKKMLLAGAGLLQRKKEIVDSLNVFPVPDGDTGTNMSLTMISAVNEINKVSEPSVDNISEALSNGSLMGARGNSGVILSQLFRGFYKGCQGKKELDSMQFAKAWQLGVDTAYKAVMKPVEGTILTVARESFEAAVKIAREEKDIEIVLTQTIDQARKTLKKTPDLLPVLKEAGVVDAGGKGLIYILFGALQILKGLDVDSFLDDEMITQIEHQKPGLGIETDIEFQYCTEFLIIGENMEVDNLRNHLSILGDSLLAVGSPQLIKVHIHSNFPGKVLDIGQEYGEITKIKIDNMKEQHSHILEKEEKVNMKDLGVIAVTSGEGLKEILLSMGVDVIVTGGQTMNPSTEDFLKAVEEINAREIIILPNNSNIHMAAEQTKHLTEKPIRVVPTKSFPQSIAAMMVYDTTKSLIDNYNEMVDSISLVKTGQVTYAVRNSQMGDLNINQGDILGLSDGVIQTTGNDVYETSINLLKSMVTPEIEIITVFYGDEISMEQSKALHKEIEITFPECEVEFHQGGQPLYYYIFSLE